MKNREFEAESISYLVCMRLGIESPSREYLSSYLENDQVMSDIGLEYVMKSAGLVEQMGLRRLKPRKTRL